MNKLFELFLANWLDFITGLDIENVTVPSPGAPCPECGRVPPSTPGEGNMAGYLWWELGRGNPGSTFMAIAPLCGGGWDHRSDKLSVSVTSAPIVGSLGIVSAARVELSYVKDDSSVLTDKKKYQVSFLIERPKLTNWHRIDIILKRVLNSLGNPVSTTGEEI